MFRLTFDFIIIYFVCVFHVSLSARRNNNLLFDNLGEEIKMESYNLNPGNLITKFIIFMWKIFKVSQANTICYKVIN